jgi:NAD(P)-dependent dehydrogenase (short-subunit alcohol dehydrogenase family)
MINNRTIIRLNPNQIAMKTKNTPHLKAFGMMALVSTSMTAEAKPVTADIPAEGSRKTVLVTGAASGIGKETAIRFSNAGYLVYATDKDTLNLKALEARGCRTLYLDVTLEESIVEAVARINRETSGVDILVNNAGYGQNGTIEEVPIEAIKQQYDVNVFGLIRVTQEVLPGMRARRSGRIINVGSVGGEFTTPGASIYHSTKYALESITDGMRGELRSFGIDVVLIKPGGVRTNFIHTSNRLYPEPIDGNPYGEFRNKFNEMTNAMFDPGNRSFGILSPEQVAGVIYQSATVKKPRTRYRIGMLAKITPRLRRMRSDRGWDKFMLKQIGTYEPARKIRERIELP